MSDRDLLDLLEILGKILEGDRGTAIRMVQTFYISVQHRIEANQEIDNVPSDNLS